MEFNTQELVWTRQPQAAKITATTIDITTAPILIYGNGRITGFKMIMRRFYK